MRVHLMLTIYFFCAIALAQTDTGKLSPVLTTMTMDPGTVTVLHLAEGYSTSVKVPEEISSVVIGNPSRFKAEHSESEPQLVFLKPTSELQCESNALITTKSGKEISLYLVSRGKAAPNARVDFFIEYRRPVGLGMAGDRESVLVPETHPVGAEPPIEAPPRALTQQKDFIAEELEKEKGLSSPQWDGTELLAAVGNSVQHDDHTIVGFSVFNGSKRIVEILPPQLELTGTRRSGVKQIKAEPVPISEYRITARKLEPGQRADGVVVFERPSFKQYSEKLQLEVAEAAEVDRPLLLPVPFTSGLKGEVQ